MTRTTLLLIISVFSLHSQVIFKHPLSPRNANYRIFVTLNTDKKILEGSEEIRWINLDKNPAEEVRFHLYMNAFRSVKSSFMSGVSKSSASSSFFSLEQPGGIEISRFEAEDLGDLTDRIEFIHLDDGNEDDSTVIRISLPRPVRRGEELTMRVRFTCRLPQIVARTGFAHNFFMIAQWFPKMGVYEDGEWSCHQFFSNSEFYADFGVYEVELTLPTEYVAASTGILLEENLDDSLKTMKWRAEDVHDFVITAWPGYREKFWDIDHTRVRLLYAPAHENQIARYFEAIDGVMRRLNQLLLPYPYPNLTLVDPPFYAFKASGMEYPCFISCGSIWKLPGNIRLFPEEVTIHEYIHQYFYGILASNEAEEPWLDEGFTTYTTAKIMASMYGDAGSFAELFGIPIPRISRHRVRYMKKPDLNIVLAPSWEYSRRESGLYSYDKSALILKTLERYLGRNTMDRVLKTYVNRYKFRHPKTTDFISTVNEISGKELDWFFDQALGDTSTIDYSVERISFTESPVEKSADLLQPELTSEVIIRREGSFTFPVEIICHFSSGDTVKELWDGQDSVLVLRYIRPDRIVSAEIDPNSVLWLDLNWTNNSLTTRENQTPFLRHWLKSLRLFQQALTSTFPF
ncbi:MAG: M1 family metallopeptidase [Calditrichaeota bacterium]|nr:M1 family metallopeptidase [Calditrichota bacterium]